MHNSNLSHQSHHAGGSYLRSHRSTSSADRHGFAQAVKLGLTIVAIIIIAILMEVA